MMPSIASKASSAHATTAKSSKLSFKPAQTETSERSELTRITRKAQLRKTAPPDFPVPKIKLSAGLNSVKSCLDKSFGLMLGGGFAIFVGRNLSKTTGTFIIRCL